MFNFIRKIKQFIIGKIKQIDLMSVFIFLMMAICILWYIPNPKIDLTVGKYILVEWCLLFFIGMFFVKNKWLKFWTIWMLVCFVTLLNKYSYMQLNTILAGIIFYQILENRFTEKSIRWTFNAIAIIVLVHALWIWLQKFDIWWIYSLKPGFSGHLPGVMGQKSSATALLMIGVPVFLRKRWCVLLPFVLITLFLPGSFTGLIASVFGIVTYLALKDFSDSRIFLLRDRRWRFSLIAILGIGFIIYALTKRNWCIISGGKGRFETWKYIWKIAKQKPFKGWGVGQYRILFPKIDAIIFRKTRVAWFRAHNEPLELMFNQGLISVGLMFGFIFSSIERFLKNRTELGFIAFIGVVITLVSCFGHFIAHSSPFIISIIYMAAMVNQSLIKEAK